jgi:hypothetical protein
MKRTFTNGCKMSKTQSLFIAAVAVVAALVPALAKSQGILGYDLKATSLADRPDLAGSVIASADQPFSMTFNTGDVISGILHSSVVRATSSGTLDFYYQFSNDNTSTGSFYSASVGSWGLPTLVGYRTDSGGDVNPYQVFSGDVPPSYRLVYVFGVFGFGPAVDPGESSRVFFFRSNLTDYSDNGIATVAGQVVGDDLVINQFIQSFAPVAVPEPSTLALGAVVLLVLGGIGLMARGRRIASTN